jgi:hypothetical protein
MAKEILCPGCRAKVRLTLDDKELVAELVESAPDAPADPPVADPPADPPVADPPADLPEERTEDDFIEEVIGGDDEIN